uniref:Dynein regulatory complex protein 1 n=1 Tax=Knipowitschia caucasica TaxID=637954 RepID=A0AAV2MP37_KNICA
MQGFGQPKGEESGIVIWRLTRVGPTGRDYCGLVEALDEPNAVSCTKRMARMFMVPVTLLDPSNNGEMDVGLRCTQRHLRSPFTRLLKLCNYGSARLPPAAVCAPCIGLRHLHRGTESKAGFNCCTVGHLSELTASRGSDIYSKTMELTLGASAEAAEVLRRTATDNAPNIRATQEQTDHLGPRPWLTEDTRARMRSLLEVLSLHSHVYSMEVLSPIGALSWLEVLSPGGALSWLEVLSPGWMFFLLEVLSPGWGFFLLAGGSFSWLDVLSPDWRFSLLEVSGLQARERQYVAVVHTQTQELQELLLKVKEDERALIETLRNRQEQQQKNEDQPTSPSEPETPLWERCQEVEEYVQSKKQEYMKKFMMMGKAMGATSTAADCRAIQAQLKRYNDNEVQKVEGARFKKHIPNVRKQISSLRTQTEEMQIAIKKQNESLENKKKRLKRLVQNRENHQKRSVQRALLGAIQYERMWLTQEEEARELLERAQNLDQWIYEHVLHQPRENPWVFPKPGSCQDPGAGEKNIVEAPSSVPRLIQILCEEAGFLMEVEEVVEANGRTLVKRGYLLETLGITENNLEKFLHFLQNYEPRDESQAPGTGAPGSGAPGTGPPGATATGARARGGTVPETTAPGATAPGGTAPGAGCSSGPAAVTSVPSEQHEVLQAVTSFLNQRLRGRRRRRVTSLQVIRDPDYWDRVGKVIPEETLPKMEMIQEQLRQRYDALKESLRLSKQVQSLQLETTQLKMAQMRLQDPQDPQERS